MLKYTFTPFNIRHHLNPFTPSCRAGYPHAHSFVRALPGVAVSARPQASKPRFAGDPTPRMVAAWAAWESRMQAAELARHAKAPASWGGVSHAGMLDGN